MTELMPSELSSASQVTSLVKSHPNKSKNVFVDLTLLACILCTTSSLDHLLHLAATSLTLVITFSYIISLGV